VLACILMRGFVEILCIRNESDTYFRYIHVMAAAAAAVAAARSVILLLLLPLVGGLRGSEAGVMLGRWRTR